MSRTCRASPPRPIAEPARAGQAPRRPQPGGSPSDCKRRLPPTTRSASSPDRACSTRPGTCAPTRTSCGTGVTRPCTSRSSAGARADSPIPCFHTAWYMRRIGGVDWTETGNPLLHYAHEGERQDRQPAEWFDTAWYRRQHAPVEASTLLAHYLARRCTGTVSPLPEFDAAWYLARYPDIAAAGVDPFEHYLHTGFHEGRDPSPDFETRFYRATHLRDRPELNPLLHWRRFRNAESLPIRPRPLRHGPKQAEPAPARPCRGVRGHPPLHRSRTRVRSCAAPAGPRAALGQAARLLPPAVPRHPRERRLVGQRLHGMDRRRPRHATLRRAPPAAGPAGPRALHPGWHRHAAPPGRPGPRRRAARLRLPLLLGSPAIACSSAPSTPSSRTRGSNSPSASCGPTRTGRGGGTATTRTC